MTKQPTGAPNQPHQQAAYDCRIRELRDCAAEECITVNGRSETDFRQFVAGIPAPRRASLVLTDDGNLRAAWRNDPYDGNHLGLEFRGDGRAVYVIFRRQPDNGTVSHCCGTDTLDGIRRRLAAPGLQRLVTGG